MGQVRRAEELQLLVLLRLARRASCWCMQIVTGIFLTMNYKPDATKAFESVEYIMRDVPVGLADPLHALDRRVDVLHRRLPAHVPRPDVRQLPQAARADLDLRLPHLPRADGAKRSSATCCRGARCRTGARR